MRRARGGKGRVGGTHDDAWPKSCGCGPLHSHNAGAEHIKCSPTKPAEIALLHQAQGAVGGIASRIEGVISCFRLTVRIACEVDFGALVCDFLQFGWHSSA